MLLDLAGEESDLRTATPDSTATLGKTLVVGLRAVCGCVGLRAVSCYEGLRAVVVVGLRAVLVVWAFVP